MPTTLQDWRNHDLVDQDGKKIGTITDVYADTDTSEPEWIAVSTGLFGTRVSFVPLQGLEADRDVLVSPWSKDQIKDAPNAEADGRLSEDEEDRLYGHYGMQYGKNRSTSGLPEGGAPMAGRAKGDGDGHGGDGRRGGGDDDAMTRSEEELRTGTRSEEVGRARLRKWVETEHQTVTVPVRKEKVRLETEPITDENRDRAMSGPDITESEHEIVLNEERPVVDTEVVPKERVRLEKDTDVAQETVGADLRKERVELDDDTSRSSRD